MYLFIFVLTTTFSRVFPALAFLVWLFYVWIHSHFKIEHYSEHGCKLLENVSACLKVINSQSIIYGNQVRIGQQPRKLALAIDFLPSESSREIFTIAGSIDKKHYSSTSENCFQGCSHDRLESNILNSTIAVDKIIGKYIHIFSSPEVLSE